MFVHNYVICVMLGVKYVYIFVVPFYHETLFTYIGSYMSCLYLNFYQIIFRTCYFHNSSSACWAKM